MISRKHRFHGHGSLNYVYRNGRTVRGQMSSLKFVRNKRRTDYRLAIVVSRKVHKSAVTRNRIRRRLYEAFRAHESDIQEPYDMVLTVFSEQIAKLSAEAVDRLVVELLKQADIIKT